MMDWKRAGARWTTMLLAVSLLSACATTGDDSLASAEPSQVAPVTDSSVDSASLPPIGGADGSVQVASADPDQTDGPATVPATTNQPGTPLLPANNPNATNATSGQPSPAAPQQAFVSLNDVGKVQSTPGRDLTGALTVDKLLGGWTVASGNDQCRLNLTYTTTSDPNRYRASAPGCAIQALAAVSSWQLAGTQVQLFNDSNVLVGALLLSGNRFIGTLAGGQAISMVG